MLANKQTKDWTCSRKAKFKTYGAADSRRRMQKDTRLRVYLCAFCSNFHLGHGRQDDVPPAYRPDLDSIYS